MSVPREGSHSWSSARAWKARIPQGIEGSNPSPSAPYRFIGLRPLLSVSLTGRLFAVVLGGELAVPCTRNPLQRGRTPPQGEPASDHSRAAGVEGRVLRGRSL